MAAPTTIRIMISSRSLSRVFGGGVTLRQCRERLKEDLQAQTLCGAPLFEVWIHEDAPAPTRTTWEESLFRRKEKMETAMREALLRMGGTAQRGRVAAAIRGRRVLLVCHGIPARCRDSIATQARIEELLRWLEETAEAERLVARARARRRIAATIAHLA